MGSKKFSTAAKNFKHNIKLNGVTRVYFVKSAWENLDIDEVSFGYACYRTLFLLYFVVWSFHSIYRSDDREYYLLYATRWSLLIQTFYAIIFAFHIYYRLFTDRRTESTFHLADPETSEYDVKPKKMIWLDSLTWLCLSIVQTAPYIVSLGYWLFVYDSSKDDTDFSSVMLNLTAHGFNAVLALIDLFVIAIPIRAAHSVYTAVFVLVYTSFTAIYEAAGGTYDDKENEFVYSFLNWKEKPSAAAIASVIAIIAGFLLHLGIWVLYRLRLILVPVLKQTCCACCKRV